METTTGQGPATQSAATDPAGLTACHLCDLLHRTESLPDDHKALCSRCGSLLYQRVPGGAERTLALTLSAAILFALANSFPFLSLKIGGRIEENQLLSGALAFFGEGMWELGLLVFLTSFLFPLLTLSGMLYVLLAARPGSALPGAARVFRFVQAVAPWSLIGVFMLGVLVSIVKLLDLATVIPGISLYAFALLLPVATAARLGFDRHLLWPLPAPSAAADGPTGTARDNDLVSCHACGLLVASPPRGHHARCPRCGDPLHGRKSDSLNRSWALIVSATLLLIPANLYPVMTVLQLGDGEPNTIISGVIHLIEADMWPLALLVFFASFVVPLVKLAALSFLLISVRRRSRWRPADRTRLYRSTELIGAWSMVDVFLVAILIALVDLAPLATVEPGIGVSFFAAVVVLTLFAAHSFDTRLIWDNCGEGA